MVKRVILVVIVGSALLALLLFSQRGGGPLKVSGFIEADEIRLGSRVGGRVGEVLVEEGQAVKAGQVLVTLEPYDLQARRAMAAAELAAKREAYTRFTAGYRAEEVAQARAQRDRAKADLDKLIAGPRAEEIAAAQAQVRQAEAQAELYRIVFQQKATLRKKDAATQDELDTAEQQFKAARAVVEYRQQQLSELQAGSRKEDIANARAAYESADQALQLLEKGYRAEDIASAEAEVHAAEAALQAIDSQVEELTVKAPVDGVIEAAQINPGDMVPPNAPILSMIDPANLWVRAYVPENHLDLQLGQRVEVKVDSYPDHQFAGTIGFIARQAEFTPGNVQTPEERSKQVFRIKVMLEEGTDVLRPGMTADVKLEGRDKQPRDANSPAADPAQ